MPEHDTEHDVSPIVHKLDKWHRKVLAAMADETPRTAEEMSEYAGGRRIQHSLVYHRCLMRDENTLELFPQRWKITDIGIEVAEALRAEAGH